MADIARRSFLQGVGVTIGASVALGSHALAQPRPAGARRYVFFEPAEAAFVESAADRFIPPEPDWPGGRAAGVPNYIDLQLAGPYGRGERLYLEGPIRQGLPGQGYQLGLSPAELYRTSLAAIADELKRQQIDFATAAADRQDAFLKRLEAGELRIGDFPSSIFFETLLANCIEGYFADPAYGGNKDMTSWRMIGFPGAYAAYVDIYTQHGLHFDREPIAMADSGHAHGGHATGRGVHK